MTPANKAERQHGSSSSEAFGSSPTVVDKGEADLQSSRPLGPLQSAPSGFSQGRLFASRSDGHLQSSFRTKDGNATSESSSSSTKPAMEVQAFEEENPAIRQNSASQPLPSFMRGNTPMQPKPAGTSKPQVSSTSKSAGNSPKLVSGVPVPLRSIGSPNERIPQLVPTPRRIQSSPSAHSSNDSNERDSTKEEGFGSDTSNPMAGYGPQSGRSGVTPPLETSSISSEPQVPTTVEVPAQPKLAMTRPSSTPSMSQMHTVPQPIAVAGMTPLQPHTPLTQAMAQQQQQKPRQVNTLRRGKWTVEEEAYVARVIQDFNSGYLNAPAGTTLRSYLSDKLHCDPMRITKKFTGDACIGKRVFHPAVRCPSNTAAIDKAQAELDALERRWRRRLEMQQRESAKKAAASAAAAAAAASGRGHFHTPTTQPPSAPQTQALGTPQHLNQNIVTRTASWLDRANAILSTGQNGTSQPVRQIQPAVNGSQDHAQAVRSLPATEIEDQMKEVQRLIHEGPIIQQTTAGLPNLLDQPNAMPSHSYQTSASGHESPQPPVDKRARHMNDAEITSGAADAEALVGFLNSVRAAAAANATSDRPS